MQLKIKALIAKAQPIFEFCKRYSVFILVIITLIIVSFFVFRINQYSNVEPSDTNISEKLKTVQRPKIDKAILDKIDRLQGQNIQVQSLFDKARNNPFSE